MCSKCNNNIIITSLRNHILCDRLIKLSVLQSTDHLTLWSVFQLDSISKRYYNKHLTGRVFLAHMLNLKYDPQTRFLRDIVYLV